MPAVTQSYIILEDLVTTIPPHFAQAQHSTNTHRKNAVSLFGLHRKVSAVTEETPRGTRLTGEKRFNDIFLACLNRVLIIKKGEPVADRVLMFVAFYVDFAQKEFRKARAKAAGRGKRSQATTSSPPVSDSSSSEDELEEEESTCTRFVNTLLKHLLLASGDRDKNIRMRSCQTLGLVISDLESIDDELYDKLVSALLSRAQDTEPAVRAQAAVALAKLQPSEEITDDGDPSNITQTLFDVLRSDTSAEVRRAVLFHLNPTAITLPRILERLRDTDTVTRRCVYLRSLRFLEERRTAVEAKDGYDGPEPLALTEQEANLVISTGLGEREETVKAAAKKLIGIWADADLTAAGNDPLGGLEAFLCRFDPLSSGATLSAGAAPTIALHSAIHALLEVRPAVLDYVDFSDAAFWTELSPRRALLLRAFVEHCKKVKDDARLDEHLPPVTALAFRLQEQHGRLLNILNELLRGVEGSDDIDDIEAQQEILLHSALETEFILAQLLSIVTHCDYGDEIGRRKMFGLVREMLSASAEPAISAASPKAATMHAALAGLMRTPESLVPACLDVLLRLSAGLKDFMRVVVEIVQADEEMVDEGADTEAEGEDDEDSQDEDGDDTPVVNGKKGSLPTQNDELPESAAAVQKAVIDARRLGVVRGMLERIGGGLQEKTALHGLIPQLIAPAVRSKDAKTREEGLVCLGLCCLLDSQLAVDTLPLFLDQLQRGTDGVKQRATHIVLDLLGAHGVAWLCGGGQAARAIAAAGDDITPEDLAQQEAAIRSRQTQMLHFILGLLMENDPPIQAIVAEGVAKLMVSGALSATATSDTETPDEDDALESLVLVYMSPDTADNLELRQCLSYFLPAYCYSAKGNQSRLQRVFVNVLRLLTDVYEDPEREDEMITPAQIGLQLVDWTNPNKAAYPGPVDDTVHVDLAITLVKMLFLTHEKSERKVACSLLGKLILPQKLDNSRGMTLLLLITKLSVVNPIEETVPRNALPKFEASLKKHYPELASLAAEAAKDLSAAISAAADAQEGESLESLRIFLEEECKIDLDDAAETPARSRPKPLTAGSRKAAASSKTKAAATSASRSRKAPAESHSSESSEEEESEEEGDEVDSDEEDELDIDAQIGGTRSNTRTGRPAAREEDDSDED